MLNFGSSLLSVLFPFMLDVFLPLLLMPPIQRRLVVGRQQEADEYERLEPGDVGVEPVVDGELEGDNERRRECCEPAQRLLARHEGDEYGEEDGERHQRSLHKRELRDLTEQGPRTDPVALEGEGVVVEAAGRLNGMPVQQDDPERDQYDPGPAEHEIYDGLTLATFVHDPEWTQDERIKLDGEAGCDAHPPGYRRGLRREPYRRDGSDDDVVGRCAFQDTVGANDPGVALVYDAGVDVEAEDEAPGKTGEHHQDPHREVARLLDLLAYPETHEKGPDEEVDKRRVPQDNRFEDYSFPEKAVRDEEPEQRHDIQISYGKQPVRTPESSGEG